MVNRVPNIDGGYSRKGVLKDKPRSMLKSWKMILLYLKNHKAVFLFSMFMVGVESLLTVFAPNYISEITDLISDGLYSGVIDLEKVSYYGLIILGLYLFGTIAMFLRNYLMADLSQHVAREMRNDMQEKMDRLPLKFFDTCRKGDVMSRFTNDADTVASALNRSMAVFVHGIVLLVLCSAMMLLTDVTLSAVCMITVFAGMGLSSIVVKRTQKYYRSQQRNLGRMYGFISELYSAHDIAMAYSASRLNKKEFDSVNEELRASGFRSEITMGLLPAVMRFFGNLGYIAVCIVGSVMVLEGSITIGTVVAFIFFVKIYMGPLDMISSSLGNIQAAGAGAERIRDFLSAEEMDPEKEGVTAGSVRGSVEFRNVCFGYLEGEETLKNLTFSVKPGQKIAIVGHTGAGKTTIVNLLMRFYEIGSGEITIDGISIGDMSRRYLRSLFCIVLQDSWLFDGTLRENIAYCSDAGDAEILEACRSVGLDRLVESLPDGLDTRIRSGTGFSGGQKQQICIARALLDKSPMLILDEATSSVDTRTEVLIQNAIDRLAAGRTSFVIAHRLSTVRNADLILVIRDGSVVQMGTHSSLLEKDGEYRRIYRSQFDPLRSFTVKYQVLLTGSVPA